MLVAPERRERRSVPCGVPLETGMAVARKSPGGWRRTRRVCHGFKDRCSEAFRRRIFALVVQYYNCASLPRESFLDPSLFFCFFFKKKEGQIKYWRLWSGHPQSKGIK